MFYCITFYIILCNIRLEKKTCRHHSNSYTFSRFKSKYHPEECDKKHGEQKLALQARQRVFASLRDKSFFEDVNVDNMNTEKLVKIMDASELLIIVSVFFQIQSLLESIDERKRQLTKS